MRRWIRLFVAVMMFAGCSGSQDYKERPTTPQLPFFDSPEETIPPTQEGKPTVPVRENSTEEQYHSQFGGETPQNAEYMEMDPSVPEGFVFEGMKWTGVSPARVDSLRCQLRDPAGVRTYDALGYAMLGGAVLGVLVRLGGSMLFGAPADPNDDGHGHGHAATPPSSGSSGKTVFGYVHTGIKTVVVSGLYGATAFVGCQTLLAGGNFTSFRGILGQDFAGASSALLLAGGTALAIHPAIRRLFRMPPKDPLRSEKATRDAEVERPYGPPTEADFVASMGQGGRALNGAGSFQRFAEWSKNNDFARGAIYRVMPGVLMLGLSSTVGVLIYQDLAQKADPSYAVNPHSCDEPDRQLEKAAPLSE